MSGAPEEFSPSAVSKLENHIIVLGYGLLGIYVVEKLKQMGLPHVVVVRDESLLPSLQKSHVPSVGVDSVPSAVAFGQPAQPPVDALLRG